MGVSFSREPQDMYAPQTEIAIQSDQTRHLFQKKPESLWSTACIIYLESKPLFYYFIAAHE